MTRPAKATIAVIVWIIVFGVGSFLMNQHHAASWLSGVFTGFMVGAGAYVFRKYDVLGINGSDES